MQACRDLLDGKEALARQNATAPDIEKEWSKFSSQHTTQKDIRHKGELNSPDGAPKGKTRNIDTFGRKLSVPAVKRMRFIGLSIVLIAASIALLFWLYAPAHSYYTVFEARTVAQEISIHTHEGKNLLTVPRGMNNQITLTDGTRIWLNAESQLEYPENFKGQEKRVVRLKGEAYFEVTPDKDRPFIVETDELAVRALGTSFNVKSYEEEKDVSTVLMTGKVEVTSDYDRLVLNPNERIVFNKQTGHMEKSTVENTGDYINWKYNALTFNGETFENIVHTLERYYNTRIVFESETLKKYRFTGTPGNTSLESILQILSLTSPLSYEVRDSMIILRENVKQKAYYEKALK